MTNFFDLPPELRDMVYAEYFSTHINKNIGKFTFSAYMPGLLFAHPQISMESAQVVLRLIGAKRRTLAKTREQIDGDKEYWRQWRRSRTGHRGENKCMIRKTQLDLATIEQRHTWLDEFAEGLKCS